MARPADARDDRDVPDDVAVGPPTKRMRPCVVDPAEHRGELGDGFLHERAIALRQPLEERPDVVHVGGGERGDLDAVRQLQLLSLCASIQSSIPGIETRWAFPPTISPTWPAANWRSSRSGNRSSTGRFDSRGTR